MIHALRWHEALDGHMLQEPQVGVNGTTNRALPWGEGELEKDSALYKAAVRIQSRYRGYVVRKVQMLDNKLKDSMLWYDSFHKEDLPFCVLRCDLLPGLPVWWHKNNSARTFQLFV
jgi:IQ calmodulin-binding motif